MVNHLNQWKASERNVVVKRNLDWFLHLFQPLNRWHRGIGVFRSPAHGDCHAEKLLLGLGAPASAGLLAPSSIAPPAHLAHLAHLRHCLSCCHPHHSPPSLLSSHRSKHSAAELNSSSSYRLCLGLAGKDQCFSSVLWTREETSRGLFSSPQL